MRTAAVRALLTAHREVLVAKPQEPWPCAGEYAASRVEVPFALNLAFWEPKSREEKAEPPTLRILRMTNSDILGIYAQPRPTDFPAEPSRVSLVTTDARSIWLGPNQNVDGVVCLSLLGTWLGPVWKSSVHSIWTVLRAVQSPMTEKGFHNKPALVRGRVEGSDAYYDFQLYETLRAAVCDEV
ncbi:hypothetical protein HPB49_022164 [Dermacentor silvarum]|uniref:Uncharacterized protein n=1 Tax=Dermacentor silvarum TaxID=543639 RepID=A0ACB8E2X6_DERSI|nr:hypothetical protein HPB49_022164 [Dermacentor silvarum]